jgi:hypothetical protein
VAAELIVRIVGDSSSLQKELARATRSSKRFGRDIENAGRGAIVASIGFRGLGRAVGYASASFLGAAGFTAAVKAGFDEMMAGQAVAADTAAVLKSTGRVAGVTAGQVNRLATSMQQLSGYDDEAIASAENLLLTFTNIRDVAGKNNDVFTQTIKSTLDLSRRFDQDLSTSAVQLGKALEDPVRGVTALRRAGISFSTDQQRVINRLVSTGHLLDAQKIILQEVRRETGNAAKAYGQTMAGQLDILKGNLTNLAGELAQTLNPEVKRLTTNFNKWLANPENKKKIIDDFTTSVRLLGDAAGYAAAEFKAMKGFGGFLYDVWSKIPGSVKKGIGIGLLGPGGQLIKELAGGGKPKMSTDYFVPRPAAPRVATWGDPAGLATRHWARPPGTAPRAAVRPGVTATQRNQWFDAMIGRELVDVQDIQSMKGQISRLREISAQITARIAVTKDITRKLTLEEQVKSIARDIRTDRQSIADAAKQRAEDAAQAAKDARQAAIDLKMGWLDFAVERADATKTIRDDIKAQQAIIKYLQTRMKQEGRSLELVRGIWEARQKIRDLNKKNADVDPLAGLQQVSSRQLANILAAGTGLGPAGRRVLGMNIAGAEIQPVHVHVHMDSREVASVVSKQQARTGRRTAKQTSGFRG